MGKPTANTRGDLASRLDNGADPQIEGGPDIGPEEADHTDIEEDKRLKPDYEGGSPDIRPGE